MNASQPGPLSVSSPGEAVSSQSTILERVLHVHINGTLTNLAMAGDQAAIWRCVDGQQNKVFGLSADMDSKVSANSLRTALIHEVNVLEHQSTFPVSLGLRLNCVPSREMTDDGNKYTYTVLPNSTSGQAQNVYRCDSSIEEGLEWRKTYPKWNNGNLESEGVLNVENVPYVFVHQDHPIIGLLRHNASLIGCDIDSQPKIDNEWYKVTRQVLSVCCNTLRQKVLSKVASNDLNTLQVQAFRLHSENWDDINDLAVPAQALDKAKQEAEAFITTPYSYSARVHIKYELQVPTCA
jgi:hypothetical protein